MLLVGSWALKRFVPLDRQPADEDFICTHAEFQAWLADAKACGHQVQAVYPVSAGKKMVVRFADRQPAEFEIAWPGSTAEEILGMVAADPLLTWPGPNGTTAAVPDLLLLLKLSHRYLRNSPHFLKTMRDVQALRNIDARVRPEWADLLKRREKETYTYLHPSLNQSKDGFFANDGLTYVWDHDDVHRAVALDGVPAYTLYMRDGAEVACDRTKFEALPLETRIRGVVEEACVLAVERSLVPHPGVWSPEKAWTYALGKICTSITSGWFREFAWESYDAVVAAYPVDYWDRFQAAIAAGRVRRAT